ncbi:MAG: arsenic resistance N-acetyltransferase ArsN2 [Candidatus Rokuibacteriota bacterium]
MGGGEARPTGGEPPAVDVDRGRPDELDAVLALLTAAGLPREGVAEHFGYFLVARANGRVVGAVGMEPYGAAALLRSLVVAPEHRGCGLGRALAERLLDEARARDVARVFLLTETAADFFARLGLERIGREDADPAVGASVEFQSACPRSAACMRLGL